METDAYLEVEMGSPFEPGDKIPLKKDGMQIGRVWNQQRPDLAFDDGRISRKHAEITFNEGNFKLKDLPSSKNGTEVNGTRLEKGVLYTLKHADKIVLAEEAAVFRFYFQTGNTQDMGGLLTGEIIDKKQALSEEPVSVDLNRRDVLVKGKVLKRRIIGREFELLALLYLNKGIAVSHEEIIKCVWKDLEDKYNLTNSDVTTLVHRLKGHLGEHQNYIVNIQAFGYMLDFNLK